MTERKISALLIAGPTASGKSHFALRAAERLGGVLINADSMQVYRDLRVLTARPSVADEARVPHFLFGHIDGALNYSVGRYIEEVASVLAQLRNENVLPIFAGGSGLYFKALTQGLSEMPRVSAPVRAEWRAQAETMPVASLHAELAARDPIMAARVTANRSAAHFACPRSLHGDRAEPGFFSVCKVKAAARYRNLRRDLSCARAGRTESSNRPPLRRDDGIWCLGRSRGASLSRTRPEIAVMRALGVPQLLEYIEGRTGLNTAIENAKRDTRAYPKRQFTFARNQLTGFRWLAPNDVTAQLAL